MVLGVVLRHAGAGYGVCEAQHQPAASSPGRRRVRPGAGAAPARRHDDRRRSCCCRRPRADRVLPPLHERGAHGPRVRELQSRTRQLAWFFGDVTTLRAVRRRSP